MAPDCNHRILFSGVGLLALAEQSYHRSKNSQSSHARSFQVHQPARVRSTRPNTWFPSATNTRTEKNSTVSKAVGKRPDTRTSMMRFVSEWREFKAVLAGGWSQWSQISGFSEHRTCH